MTIQRRALRFDLGEIRESSRTPQGFLKVPGFATRVGVFPYMDGSGKIRRELRHPDDVFDPQSLETLKNAPVTIEHPPEMIGPENVDEYSVGHTTERVDVVDDKVDTDMIVESIEGINAIEQEGIRELSCGYAADIIEEGGEFNGAPYDFRQINIRYNHLAMVKRGRAGPEIRMRLDSADAVMQEGQISEPPAGEFTQEAAADADEDVNAVGEPKTKKLVIAAQEVELPSDVADVMQDYLDRYDEMRAKLAQLEEEMKKQPRKDEDVNQKGISPQVKVEQQGPDGRAAGGKTGAKPGTITGPVGKADDEKEKEDEEEMDGEGEAEQGDKGKNDEEAEKDDADAGGSGMAPASLANDFEAGAGSGAGGAAMGPVERMKQDIEGIKAAYKGDADLAEKCDAVLGKMDAFAASSMGKDEKRGDSKGKRVDSVQAAIRSRVKLERMAEKLVPFEVAQKFDSMSDDEVRGAVIKHHSPRAELEGKSTTYIQARFDSMCEQLEETDSSEFRKEAGKRMLGINGSVREDSEEDVDPSAARMRMIKSARDEYKTASFAANKK